MRWLFVVVLSLFVATQALGQAASAPHAGTSRPAAGAAGTLAALTDTDTTGAVNGNLLYFNGSQWIDIQLGTNTQILYNKAGVITGIASFTFNDATGQVTATKYDSASVAGENGLLLKAQASMTCTSIGANNVKMGVDSGLGADLVWICLDDDTKRRMAFGRRVITESGTNPSLAAADAYDTVIRLTNGAAVQLELPAAVVGMRFCVFDDAGTGLTSLNPNGSEEITISGGGIGAGDELDSASNDGGSVCLFAHAAGQWHVTDQNEVWVDGGAS